MKRSGANLNFQSYCCVVVVFFCVGKLLPMRYRNGLYLKKPNKRLGIFTVYFAPLSTDFSLARQNKTRWRQAPTKCMIETSEDTYVKYGRILLQPRALGDEKSTLALHMFGRWG